MPENSYSSKKPDRESARLLLIAPPNSYRTVAYLKAARLHGVDSRWSVNLPAV